MSTKIYIENFSSFISKELIQNIKKSHSDIFGISIDKHILEEMGEIQQEPDYLPNLNCSDETKQFIDEFISDVKNYIATNGDEGSAYAENFVETGYFNIG